MHFLCQGALRFDAGRELQGAAVAEDGLAGAVTCFKRDRGVEGWNFSILKWGFLPVCHTSAIFP